MTDLKQGFSAEEIQAEIEKTVTAGILERLRQKEFPFVGISREALWLTFPYANPNVVDRCLEILLASQNIHVNFQSSSSHRWDTFTVVDTPTPSLPEKESEASDLLTTGAPFPVKPFDRMSYMGREAIPGNNPSSTVESFTERPGIKKIYVYQCVDALTSEEQELPYTNPHNAKACVRSDVPCSQCQALMWTQVVLQSDGSMGMVAMWCDVCGMLEQLQSDMEEQVIHALNELDFITSLEEDIIKRLEDIAEEYPDIVLERVNGLPECWDSPNYPDTCRGLFQNLQEIYKEWLKENLSVKRRQ